MKNFFDKNFDFEKQIKSHFKNSCKIKIEKVETGWTNFVFKVFVKNKCYIFRFPKNNFFANAIKKEYEFTKFISHKIGCKVPKQKLCFFDDKPYTFHKQISGESLSEIYKNLTYKQKEKIAKKLAQILHKIYKTKIPKNGAFEKVGDFVNNLFKQCKLDKQKNLSQVLRKLEKEKLVLSHGDFNPGNIIIKHGKVVGLIDFGFAGISHPLNDVARICGRTDKEFEKLFINACSKIFKQKIDLQVLEKIKTFWQKTEEAYIEYMAKNCPEVKFVNLT